MLPVKFWARISFYMHLALLKQSYICDFLSLKLQFLVTFRKKNPSHFWPQYHSFPWINFQKLHEVWKGFFNAVNLRATATFLLNSFRSYGSTKAKLNTISLFLIKEKDSSHFWPQYHSFSWIDFEKLHEVWKGFFNAVNLRATGTFLLNLFRSYGSTKAEEIMISCYF